MPRIALLIDSLISAGAQRQMVLLANGLASRGHNVSLFIYHDIMELVGELEIDKVELTVVAKKKKLDVRFVFRLASAIKSVEPNVIVSFLSAPSIWTQLGARLAGVRAIVTSERNTNFVHSYKTIAITWLAHRFSAKVVANTYTAKQRLVEHVRIPEEKIEIIQNGIDVDKFRPRSIEAGIVARTKYGLHQDDFVIVLPGRIERQKNHRCLIDAVARLDFEGLRIQICLFGNEIDMEVKEEIANQSNRLGMMNRVKFCGISKDMPEVYSMADVVVLPSRWEGLPNVILEAMACEKPVIVSDVADNRRLVAGGQYGRLFGNDDAAQLANALEQIACDTPENRRSLGARARAHIVKHYSDKSNVESYEALIDSFC